MKPRTLAAWPALLVALAMIALAVKRPVSSRVSAFAFALCACAHLKDDQTVCQDSRDVRCLG